MKSKPCRTPSEFVGIDPAAMVKKDPERVALNFAQVGNDANEHLLAPLLMQGACEVMVVDDVIVLLGPENDRNHVSAEEFVFLSSGNCASGDAFP